MIISFNTWAHSISWKFLWIYAVILVTDIIIVIRLHRLRKYRENHRGKHIITQRSVLVDLDKDLTKIINPSQNNHDNKSRFFAITSWCNSVTFYSFVYSVSRQSATIYALQYKYYWYRKRWISAIVKYIRLNYVNNIIVITLKYNICAISQQNILLKCFC